MIFDTNIAMALKNSNGEYKIEQLTIFEIEKMKTKFSSLIINVNKGNDILVEVKCPLCNEDHLYHYNINELLKRNMVIGGCEQLGLPIFLIGKNQKIIEKVNEYKQITEKICALI
ncbi:MAG: hypothetical protein ACREVX_11150 [Clostridium sp.]|uniref:hypothetical protein n=1 Tax=Clostridium sp. TaxID=1506 RepID=UPI003D6C9737